MTKLSRLIADLCQGGVEYKPLGEACHYSKSRINADEVDESSYVGVDNLLPDKLGKTFSSYVPEEGRLAQFINGDVLIGNIRPYLRKIWLANCTGGTNGDVLVIRINEKYVDSLFPKYLYYVLSSEQFFLYNTQNSKGAKMPRGSKDAIMQFPIPLPPLPVQQEIVRILDNFAELTAELAAELAARKKQYEYYRDFLLTAKDGWTQMKIIDMLCQPISDGPHTTPAFVSNGIPFISVDAVWDGRIHFESKRGYITEEFDIECSKKYKPQKHDVYMVKSGSTTGKVAYVDTDEHFNIWSPLAAMRVNEENSSRFLFHLLQTKCVQQQVITMASHGSQPNLGMRALEQFTVEAPLLAEQARIVEILDKFDALTTDITAGLPAEIEARQKQYEHYRDKLLTFKEKAV